MFLENLELDFDNMAEKDPFAITGVFDFNAKLKSWYTNDGTKFKGSKTNFLTSKSFHQILNKVTQILNNSCFYFYHRTELQVFIFLFMQIFIIIYHM